MKYGPDFSIFAFPVLPIPIAFHTVTPNLLISGLIQINETQFSVI
jgi:hypothetical protein